MNLTSIPSIVEAPFVIVTIGKYTFGKFTKSGSFTGRGTVKVTYPNFINSVSAVKVNGSVNSYTINMIYQIAAGDDPNLLEKVFGSISDTWKIKIAYGDMSYPDNVYHQEDAVITKITSQVDVASSKITYTITCVSDAVEIISALYDFPAREDKPSNIIKSVLTSPAYGIGKVLKGMSTLGKVLAKEMIASDDAKVKVPALMASTVFDYVNHCVNCMIPASHNTAKDGLLSNVAYVARYVTSAENNNEGDCIKVDKIQKCDSKQSLDTYEIDVGYPGNNYAVAFSLNNDQNWNILYKYANEVPNSEYIYTIDDKGIAHSEYSPSIARSSQLKRTTAEDMTWWTKVTQFPVSCAITIKGLVKPAILMSYVKLNVLFYGRKHIASGLYVITKQEDKLDGNGYRTILNLLRVGEDTNAF